MSANERASRLRPALHEQDLDCLLVSKIENVRYLTGFTGSSALALVRSEGELLITDPRYAEQADGEAPGWDIRVYTGSITDAVAAELSGAARCGFETSSTFQFYERLAQSLADGTELVPVDGAVESLRIVKDEAELELIRAALGCAAAGFEAVTEAMAPGKTERELAALLDYSMVLAGAEAPAFDTVLASGPNASLPHAPLTDRTLGPGEQVIIDFGACLGGYRSDTTRTVTAGRGGPGELYEVVAGALEAALSSLAPGVSASEVDAAARDYIAERGYGERFGHSLGHGVGLETHESPTLSARSTDNLEPGMVFTVEPGVYIPGVGGARLEEMVVMTDDGPVVLSLEIPLRPSA